MPRSYRARLAGENEERRLESVFCGGGVAQNVAADPEHHWAVSIDKDLEGAFIAPLAEVAQQVGVGALGGVKALEVIQEYGRGGHDQPSRGTEPILSCPAGAEEHGNLVMD